MRFMRTRQPVVCIDTSSQSHRAFDCGDDIQHSNIASAPYQSVTAVGTALGHHQLSMSQLFQQLAGGFHRQPCRRGDVGGGRLSPLITRQLAHDHDRVIG
jgi:hypothetical protein